MSYTRQEKSVLISKDEQIELRAYIFRKQYFRQAIAITARERGLTISAQDARIDYSLMIAHYKTLED